MRRHFILSDLQIPYHSPEMVGEFLYDLRMGKPATVTVIGDFVDFPTVSRWSKGTAREYLDSLQEHAEMGRSVLSKLSASVDCPVYFHMGNHEERLGSYVKRYAPGLASLEALTVSGLLDFKGNFVTEAPEYNVIDGAFATTHGHLGKLSRQAGQTALTAARRINMNVACGHSHRLGVSYESGGVHELGTRKTVWGLEVGHMMDLSKVDYQRDRVLNWQAGYGIVEVLDDGRVEPRAISLER